jgi:hypothetical protein
MFAIDDPGYKYVDLSVSLRGPTCYRDTLATTTDASESYEYILSSLCLRLNFFLTKVTYSNKMLFNCKK